MKRKIFYGVLGVCLVISLFYILSIPKASKTKLIKVGYQAGNMNYAPFYVAYAKGFFSEHNITMEPVPLASGGEVKLALSTGQIDIGFASASNFFVPISKGVPIKIIGPMASAKMYLYVRPDNETRTFEDLIGKTIAVSLGGHGEYETRRVLKEENIDATKINFVNIDKPNRLIALVDKKIADAIPIDTDEVATCSEAGAVLLEEWGTKGYDNQYRPNGVITINEDFKLSNPLLAEQFVDVIIEGHKFIKSNPEEAAEIVSLYIKTESDGASVYSPEDVNAMWKNKEVVYDLWYDPTAFVDMSEVAVDIGQLNLSLTLNQMFDLSYEEKLKGAQNEVYPID